MNNSPQPKTQKAFTLIELLVVIAIVGILAGMVTVNMSGATEGARIAKMKVYSGSIRSSLLMNRISEWKFDEGAGTSTADTVGSNPGILANSPTWKLGEDCVDGGCLSFDGTDDSVDINASWNTLLDGGTSDFTIGLWIKYLPQDNYRGIIGTYSDSNTPGLWIDVTNGSLRMRIKGAGSPYGYTEVSGGTYADGKWHFISAAGDRDALGYFYVDGVLKNSANISAQNGSIGAATIKIGKISNVFNGSIDEVRVYNAILSVSAIRGQYLAGLDKLLAGGQITRKEYQENLSRSNSTYATSK